MIIDMAHVNTSHMISGGFNMATKLTFGSVPAFYREVYGIVCPNQEHVDHDMFIKILVKSSLPKQTLTQIWEAVDEKQGHLSRNGLYKALALTALAQQGKSINDKLLETYSDQELPKPSLGDLSDLMHLSVKVRRERNPNVLGYTYNELCALDTIKVELVPEKKGLILKHVEYEVTSQRYSSTVLRRYNDFLAYQETLLSRYPYRMIPELPPKKLMGGDREFIEQRRKSLRRFLNLIVRHPIISHDQIVKYFHTFTGSDMQHKMKEHFRGVPDEFMTHENAFKAKDYVPLDTQLQFGNSKDHMRVLIESTRKIRDVAERISQRCTAYASDMLQLGKQLGALGGDTSTVTAWACGNSETWSHLKRGFKATSGEYAVICEKASSQAVRVDEFVVEILNTFLDLLLSYKELCERHEKGVLRDHQRAIQKMGMYKKKKMSATVVGPSEAGTVEQLEHRILKQENEISNMENRNYFSLHCVQMETQLIHANLQGLYCALQNLANEETRGYSQMASMWQHIKPLIDNIIPSRTSPCTSPVNSPVNNNHLQSSKR